MNPKKAIFALIFFALIFSVEANAIEEAASISVSKGKVYQVNLNSGGFPKSWIGLYGVANENGSFAFKTSNSPANGVSEFNASFIGNCTENQSLIYAIHSQYISWSAISPATIKNINDDNGDAGGFESAQNVFTTTENTTIGNANLTVRIATLKSSNASVTFKTIALYDTAFNQSVFATALKPELVESFQSTPVNYELILPKISSNSTYYFTTDPRVCNEDENMWPNSTIYQKIFEVFLQAAVYTNSSTSSVVYNYDPPVEIASNLSLEINANLTELEKGQLNIEAYAVSETDSKRTPLTLVDLIETETGMTAKWAGNFKPGELVKIKLLFKNREVKPNEVAALKAPILEGTGGIQIINLVFGVSNKAKKTIIDGILIIAIVCLFSIAAFALFSRKHYWINNIFSKTRSPYTSSFIKNNLKDSLHDLKYGKKRNK